VLNPAANQGSIITKMRSIIVAIAVFRAFASGISVHDPLPRAQEVAIFDEPVFIENIAVRSNGHVLLTTFDQGRLYTVDPDAITPRAEVAVQFPGVTALIGVAEIAPDVFAVTGGNLTSFAFVEGSLKVFTVSFDGGAGSPRVKHILDLLDSTAVNSMTVLPATPYIILVAGSKDGNIVRIDTLRGTYDVALSDPALELVPDTVPVGVNGIKLVGDFLYFANSAKGLFGRIPVHPDGSMAGAAEIITTLAGGTSIGHAYDDFDIHLDCDGQAFAYVATHSNMVYKINVDTGEADIYVGGGDSTLLKNPTSLAFAKDGKKFYVVTAGNVTSGVSGQVVEVII
jgi:hypothetical protein